MQHHDGWARERSRTPPKLSSSAKRRFRRRSLEQDKYCHQKPPDICISRERFLQLRSQWKVVPVSVCHGLDGPAGGLPRSFEESNDMHVEVWLATPAPPVLNQTHSGTELISDASSRPVHAVAGRCAQAIDGGLAPKAAPTRLVTQDELAQRISLALADATKRRRVQLQVQFESGAEPSVDTTNHKSNATSKTDLCVDPGNETRDANSCDGVDSMRDVCRQCWPARLHLFQDEDGMDTDVHNCICERLICFTCAQPGLFCTCDGVPTFVEERCMICDFALHDCLEDVKCFCCHSQLQACMCESPFFVFDTATCEEGSYHHYKSHINWKDDVDTRPGVCSKCQQLLSYEDQCRCDASACMSECDGFGNFQHICFFHEACLERVSNYMLCTPCAQAHNLPSEGSESEEMESDSENLSQDS